MKRLYAIIAVAALFSSCVKEVVEPGMRISGTYTSDDGSGLNEQYISFEDGDFSQVSLSKALSYMEDSFWGYNKSYEKVKKNPYSIQEGNLTVAGKPMGPIELKENFLLFQGKRYSKVKGFNEELYSSITLPEGTTKTITYETKEYSLPVTINRPIPAGENIATTNSSWLSEVKVQNGTLTFRASETKVDRDGTILLRYTNADNVTLSIAQRPSTFIKLAENERTISYAQASHSLSYSIETPIPGSALEVSCTANWVKNIVIGTDAITFDVDENPGNSSRVARFTCSYSGAAYVSFTLTQSGAVTAIVPTPTSQSCTYTGGNFSFDFTIENPRQGISLTATSQSAWITDVSISGNKISYKVAENSTSAQRSGRISLTYGTFATYSFIITQNFATTTITTTPESQSCIYTGGEFSFDFAIENPRQGISLTATSQSAWITDVSISGNTISYKVAENNSGNARNGKIKLTYGNFATKEFSVSQSWSASEITTTPASQEITYSGGSFSLDFSVSNPREGVTVTASSQSYWITNISVSNNKIDYKVAENNSGNARNGKIKLTYGNFATKEFTISQAWSSSEITTSPESQEVSYTSGNFSLDFSVSNPREGATVTASSQSEWITNVSISSNKVSYKVSENNSGSVRNGIIKLTYGDFATKEFSVSQSWSAAKIIITPESQNVAYTGGNFSVDFSVSNPRDGATVTASSQSEWITNVSISGNKVSYKVAENNSGTARNGKIKLTYEDFATKEFSVSQSWSAAKIIITPESQNIAYTGGYFSLDFSVINPREGATITASSQSEWITDVTVSSNKVNIRVKENNSSAQRSGSIKLSYGTYAAQSFTVTQTGKPVQSISLNTSNLELYAGSSETLTATVNPSDAELSWSSSNTSIAKVSTSGVVTGVSRGTATITVASTDGSGKSASCQVEVKQYVTGITLNKTALTLNEGQTETLSATITPDNANDKTLTWSSSDTSVATVDQTGKVTTVSKGTATITATANDGSGKKATCSVFVPTDLSSSASANSYIVSSAGTYSFKTVKGNSSTSVGSVSKAEVLWESFGTATVPNKGDIICEVSYSSNYINFITPSSLKNGNAVITAKDASGNILWSWHIWVCSGYNPEDSAQTYYNNAGTMMDRNLGATSAEPDNIGALGLLYQWGRKDPFLGGCEDSYSSSLVDQTKTSSTISWPSAGYPTTIDYTIKNPTTFIRGTENSNYDWLNVKDNSLWQSSKTIYDPCPPGWKVPEGGIGGIWEKASGVTSESSSYNWDSTNKGINFSGKFGSNRTIWYPAAGAIGNGGNKLINVGYGGSYWSCTPCDNNSYRFRLNSGGYVPVDNGGRCSGLSVRCIKE